MFSPIAVILVGFIGLGEEGTMASVPALNQSDVWIRKNLLASLRCNADKGVVERIENK
jgi:hypothetical protein